MSRSGTHLTSTDGGGRIHERRQRIPETQVYLLGKTSWAQSKDQDSETLQYFQMWAKEWYWGRTLHQGLGQVREEPGVKLTLILSWPLPWQALYLSCGYDGTHSKAHRGRELWGPLADSSQQGSKKTSWCWVRQPWLAVPAPPFASCELVQFTQPFQIPPLSLCNGDIWAHLYPPALE